MVSECQSHGWQRLICIQLRCSSTQPPAFGPHEANQLPFAIISTKLFSNSDPYELMQDLVKRTQNGLVDVRLLFLPMGRSFAIDALLAAKRHF
jgi:hypothetical protein